MIANPRLIHHIYFCQGEPDPLRYRLHSISELPVGKWPFPLQSHLEGARDQDDEWVQESLLFWDTFSGSLYIVWNSIVDLHDAALDLD